MGQKALPDRARAAEAGCRTLPPDSPAQSFVDALTELVQAQADTTGFVVLHRRVEILERHFPPRLPDLDNVAE
ncbi:hypothetical protein ACFUAC_21710 [Streptomyces sp. NPDC057148]|uniref:hypothetical protein n=1 Tax=unclassified Streptomyces TaxID=2593676 RepID=UPI00362C79E0